MYPYLNKSLYALLGVGYGYNHVFKHGYYFTVMAVPAAGFRSSKNEFPLNYPGLKESNFTIGGIGEASVGYNSTKWFYGMFGSYTHYASPGAETKLAGTQSYLMLFVGRRLVIGKRK